MHFEPRSFNPEDAKQDVVYTAFLMEQVCLVVVLQIALINLFSAVVKALDLLLPAWLLHMRTATAGTAFVATLSLFCVESNRPRLSHFWSKIFAALTAGMGTAALIAHLSARAGVGHFAVLKGVFPIEGAFPVSSIAFLMLGIAILFIRSRGTVFGLVADGAVSCLAFLMLLLVSQFAYGATGVQTSLTIASASIPTLGCLALLTVAIFIRRAERGVFSLFLGSGIGGRIARILAPIMIVVPFLRELARARLLHAQLLPTSYSTALLASMATFVSFALLIVLTRVINRMQGNIQELTLRDELTGLYNFRGFNLFAEQAFRLARRTRIPFGVLFIDMDNLKIINDELGHNAGSAYIVETAKLLNETFRETDVIGRLGGDEFVVAGQFDVEEIESILERLRSGAAERKASTKGHSLSFSMGYAATEQIPGETLKSVVARADHAMYREKREKKRLVLV